MSRDDLSRDLTGLVAELLIETKIQLNGAERQELVAQILNDMLGLGPLEPLLADETISEIMINGPKQVYIEQKGRLKLSDVQFRDNAHVLAIATRIVTAIGRRIDESTPLCDARLMDGSRVNIIIPPRWQLMDRLSPFVNFPKRKSCSTQWCNSAACRHKWPKSCASWDAAG